MTWAFIAIALVGNILIIRKNYLGFLLWVLVDSYFFGINAATGDFSQAAIFALYIIMAFYGLYTWSDE